MAVVTVPVTSLAPDKAVPSTPLLYFDQTNWSTPVDVTFIGVDDGIDGSYLQLFTLANYM